jgi:chromosome partitioning protein
VLGEVNGFLERSRGSNVPWADAKVYATRIRRNIKLAEAPGHGKTIFEYAPNCPGAADYRALALEVSGVKSDKTESPLEAVAQRQAVN